MFWRRKSSGGETPAEAIEPAAEAHQVAEPAAAPQPPAQATYVEPIAPAPSTSSAPMANAPTTAGREAAPEMHGAAKPNDKVKQISASFGEIVAVLLRSKRHRRLPISYLEAVAVPAVATGQFALAEARSAEHGHQAPIAVVIWASVSTDVDRKLAQDPSQLLRLAASDWRSGDIIWIIEAVGQKEGVQGLVERLRTGRFAGKQVRLLEVTSDNEVVAKVMQT